MSKHILKCLSRSIFHETWNCHQIRRTMGQQSQVKPQYGVVALESTVISHGMPYPANVQTAVKLKNIIYTASCVPSTIGVLQGKVQLNLSDEEIDILGRAKDTIKISRKDLAYAIAQGKNGGTTVSATAFLASKAGIRVFATGGIGGVHFGVNESWDISSDLEELSKTPIAVVCSGVKSILDIAKTLEYLETKGVPVFTLGDSPFFPGFFTRSSGILSPRNVSGPEEAAQIILKQDELGLQTGMIFAVPIPSEAEAHGQEIEDAIQKALRDAKAENIRGSQVTPFVLGKVHEETKGKSIAVNAALLENNAQVGAEIANWLKKMTTTTQNYSCRKTPTDTGEAEVVVAGGTMIDCYWKPNGPIVHDGSSHHASIRLSPGGVGRNTADALTRLGVRTRFISALGSDPFGEWLGDNCSHMDLGLVNTLESVSTAMYTAVLNSEGNIGNTICKMQMPNYLLCALTPGAYFTAKN